MTGGRLRIVAVLVAAGAFAGFTAAPAGADDGSPPMPPMPDISIPTPEAPDPATLLPDPVPTPEITITTDTADGNIAVSVRVGSPESSQERTNAVISADSGGDTTATGVQTGVQPSAPSTADSDGDRAARATNANVSVRVFSPGNDAAVHQENALDPAPDAASREPSASTEQETISPDAAFGASGNSEQYRPEDYQYQSAEELSDAPWEWSWYLLLDCNGIDTRSTEAGEPSSRVWVWSWAWSWGCDGGPSPEDGPATAGADQGSQRAPPGATGPAPSASEQGPAISGSWSWTWDFDLCGSEIPVSTPLGAGTALIWTWNWTWTWTCGAAGEPTPASGAPATSAPTIGGEAGDSSLLLAVEPTPLDGTSLSEALATPMSSDQAAGTLVEVIDVWFPEPTSIPFPVGAAGLGAMTPLHAADPIGLAFVPVVSPGTTGALLEARSTPADPAVVERPVAPHRRPLHGFPILGVDTPGDIESERPESSRRAEQREQPRQPPTASRRPPGSRSNSDGLRSHDDSVSRQASGASPSAGGGASGLLVGVVAALVASFVLAAPGIGRRIRLTRLPSPRSRDDLRIDHPG